MDVQWLEDLYRRFDDRALAHPDPVVFCYRYPDVREREIAALVASSLAFGRVEQILRSAETVLGIFGPSPRRFVEDAEPGRVAGLLAGFRHRFATGAHVAKLLAGIREALARHDTLEDCFLAGLRPEHSTVANALREFAAQLLSAGSGGRNPLVPSPYLGSACKRLCLYLRWMVRKDAIDPGGWDRVPAGKLIVPLDTHMHAVGLELGLTGRKQADMRTALEITASLARFRPDDPVRYDFALTRPGIWGGRTPPRR